MIFIYIVVIMFYIILFGGIAMFIHNHNETTRYNFLKEMGYLNDPRNGY